MDRGLKVLLGIVCSVMVLTVTSSSGFCLVISGDNVGIGTNTPTHPLEVQGGSATAIYGTSISGYGVYGSSTYDVGIWGYSSNWIGVRGLSDYHYGVYGSSNSNDGIVGYSSSGNGVAGYSDTGWAGYFHGNINVTGIIYGNGSGLTNVVPAAASVTADKIVSGAVTETKLSYNAVTPVKIAFYGNVAIVALSGGDYDNPATAMSNYSSWCDSPSETNPCLLKIMPGVYPIAASTVVMQPYIDIEGSGENVTVIKGNIGSSSSGVVKGNNNSELRFLTVINTGGGTSAFAIYNYSASPKITNVTATASGGTGENCGISNISYSSPTMTNVTATTSGGTGSWNEGVYNATSSPTMTNVTATASGGTNSRNSGVMNIYSSPTMTNVTTTASGGTGSDNRGVENTFSSPTMMNVKATGSGGTNKYGVYSSGSGYVKIDHSVIKGATNTIYNESGVTTMVGNTQLDGGAVSNGGTLTCAGVYDENYTFYASSCP